MLELLNNEAVLAALSGVFTAVAVIGVMKLRDIVAKSSNKIDDAVLAAVEEALSRNDNKPVQNPDSSN